MAEDEGIRNPRLCALLVATLATLGGCSAADQDGEGRGRLPTSATADIRVVGDASFLGGFIVNVGPGDQTARFEFNGLEDDPANPARRSLVGNFLLTPEGMQRTTAADWVEYHPDDPWLWIYDNRGSLNIFGAETRRHIVRDFSYRADPDAHITVRFVAIGTERVDAESRTILPGEDLVVEISGHWLGNCTAYDETGRVLDDPMMLLNPLCRELLSVAP